MGLIRRNVMLDEEAWKALQAMAAQRYEPASQHLRQAIREYLAKQNGTDDKAMAASMGLPAGKTCGDCVTYHRCQALIGGTSDIVNNVRCVPQNRHPERRDAMRKEAKRLGITLK